MHTPKKNHTITAIVIGFLLALVFVGTLGIFAVYSMRELVARQDAIEESNFLMHDMYVFKIESTQNPPTSTNKP